MPDFDNSLNPILLNSESNPLNLPNPATQVSKDFGSLGGLSSGEGSAERKSMTEQFFGKAPVISPMLPTVSAKELYENRRYAQYNKNIVDLEDQKAHAQSGWDQAANGILKGLNLTATTVAGGFGLLYGAAKSPFTGRLADIWDNEATRALDEINNEVDQTYLPNYYTNEEKNASWYSTDNWFKTNWLFDKLIKNSGYAAGAMLSGNIANAGLLRAGATLGGWAAEAATLAESSQAFKLFTPLLKNTARAFSVGKNIEAAAVLEKELSSIADITAKSSKLGEIAKQTNMFAQLADKGRRGIVATYASAGEASFEALQTGNEFRNNLIEKYKRDNFGQEPTGEELEKINKDAETAGKVSFFGNLGLLAVTEFVQLPNILGSNYNASRQAANSLLGRADDVMLKEGKYIASPKYTTKFGKVYDKVTGVGAYAFDIKEAGQEIGQYALQVGTQNYFNKAYRTGDADVWVDGFLYGLTGTDEEGKDVGALVSKEGIEGGILGGITGGLMQARGTYLERKERKSNTEALLDRMNSAPSFKRAFLERRNAINRGIILQQQEQDAVVNGDELEAKDLGYDYMHNYLAPRIKYGRYDLVKDDLKDLREQSITEQGFAELKKDGLANINDTRESFLERLNEVEKTADYVNELYKSLSLRYSGVLDKEGNRRYSPEVIDKMVYAASKIANYDVRIPAENQALANAQINTIEILDSIINNFSPNKAATEKALEEINKLNVISEEKDTLKASLSRLIETSMRRKLFMDEYDAIKAKPEDFQEEPEFPFGETEEMDVSVKQMNVPEGKKRKKEMETKLEVGKEYSLKDPFTRTGNKLTVAPKITILSQTLGGEYEVRMPNGQVTFLSPDQFKNYTVSEFNPVTPKLQEIFDSAIDSVLNRKKYEGIEKPVENKLQYINGLDNKELIDDIEKEFKKRSQQYLKDLDNERKKAEEMKKYSEELQKSQAEIQKGVSGPPTNDDPSDSTASDGWEDMKRSAERLFTGTTSASEDWENGTIPVHVTRFAQFLNNTRRIRNKMEVKAMLITSAQQKLFGLDGLAQLSFGNNVDKSLIVTKEEYDKLSDEKKAEVNEQGFIGAVMIKVDSRGRRFFIDKDGNSIGEVGEVDSITGNVKQVDLNKVVFSTMTSPKLYNSKKVARYRSSEKEEAYKISDAWREYRKNLFEADPKFTLEFDFGISKGISVINKTNPEKNFVTNILVDNIASLATEQVVQVSTKGEIAHPDGNNYKVPMGRPVLLSGNDLAYLNNNKLSKETAATVFAIFKELSARVSNQIANGKAVNINYPELVDFVTNILYWHSEGTPRPNKIYIDSDNNLRIGKLQDGNVVESVYDFANIEKFKDEIINDLTNSYFNVDNKRLTSPLSKPFTEIYLDANGNMQKREWQNYQTYLIASVNPDGSKRSVDAVPLYTRISKPTASVPYAFKQRYIFLLGIEMPKTTSIKKEVVSTVLDYKLDGNSVNKYTRKDLIDLEGTYEFIAEKDDEGKVVVESAPTAENDALINKIAKNEAIVKKLKDFLLSRYSPKSVAKLGEGVTFVENALPTVVNLHLIDLYKKEKAGMAPEPAPTAAPLSEIEKAVITEENYNSWSNVRDKSDYQAFVDQVKSTLAMFDQVPDKSKITAESVDQILAGVKAFSNKSIRDKVVPLIVAKYKTEAAPVTPTPPPSTSGIDLSALNDEDEAPFRKVGEVGKQVDRMTDAEVEYFKEFVKKNLPGIPYEFIENLVKVNGTDEEAWGVFEEGVAKVYKRAAKGTAFHEIMEGVWLGFLSPNEQEALLEEMRSKKGSFLDRASGKRIDYNEATNLELKERIMDDFAEYMDGKIPAKSVTGKILQFFKSIIEFFKHWIGKPSLKEKLFRDITKGKYKKYLFPEAMKKARPQYKAIEGLSEEKANDFVQDMVARMFQKIIKNNESLFEIDNTLQKLDVFNDIREKYRKVGVFNVITEEAFDKLVSRTKDYLRRFNIEFDEDIQTSVNDVNRTKDGYAVDTFSINVKKSSPYAVKILLASMIKTKRDSGPMGVLSKMPSLDTDSSSLQGGLTLVPFGQTFSTLMNRLSNVRDVPTFIYKLHELAKDNPDFAYLYTRLGGDMQSPTPRIKFDSFKFHNWRLFVSFYQVFTKQKPEGFIQFLEGNQVFTGSANQASIEKQIADEWKENMKLLSEIEDSIVKYDYDKKIYKVDKESKKWKDVNISNPAGMISFLSEIGIEFPLSAYNKLKSEDLKKFANAVSGIKTALNKSGELMNLKGSSFNMKGNIESLAGFFVSATSPDEDSTFFNNRGERQQSFTESNYPSLFESIFNSVETLDELKERMPQLNDVFSTNSSLLKLGGPFFDAEGYRIKNTPIKLQYILGDKNKDNNKGTAVSSLTIGKRHTLEINQNIAGRYYVVIPGDGSTEWMMNLGNSISFDEIASEKGMQKVYDIFYGYLRDEIALARDANERKKIKNVSSKANKLRFFRGIFSEDFATTIEKQLIDKQDVTDEDITNFINSNKEKIDGQISKEIERISLKQEKLLKDNNEITSIGREGDKFRYNGLDKSSKSLGINKFNLTGKNVSDLMKFVTTNYLINQIEYHKIIFGDPYQFKIKTEEGKKVIIDETKRIKSFLSPRRVTVNFPELNKWMNTDLNKAGDAELTKDDIGYHEHKDFAKTFTAKDMVIVGQLSSTFDAYAKTDQADASSWMNPATYREVKFKNGQWSQEAEDFYQWEMAYARMSLSSKGKYKYPSGEKGQQLKAHDETLVKKPPVKHYIEVLKPSATGNKFGKTTIDLVIDKTSQVPLFYRAVEGKTLEELFLKFFNEGYDYAIVESGRKVGIEEVHSFYNSDGTFNNSPINNTIEVPWEVYGIQVENSYDGPKLQTRGSQLTKLATVDLYSEGNAIGENEERREIIKNAVERNERSLKALVDNGYIKFLKKLGIEDLGSSFKADNKKVEQTLKQELMKRDMSVNTLDGLSVNPETGEFEYPFESSINYKKIKDILYSIVDKAITSPKMNGFSAVQVSAAMWEDSKLGMGLVEKVKSEDGKTSYKKISRKEYESLSDDRKKNITLTSSALKFYEDEDGKRHCEIMLPNWFRKKLGRNMNDEEFTKFANSEEGRSALTGIGFRIPTQALNSVEVFVVKGFLPEFMGKTVIVPAEITTKAGSDFDIDKLNLYLKNVYVTPNGDIKEVPFFGVGEEGMQKIKDFLLEEDLKAMLSLDEEVTGDREEDYDTLAERLYNESLENEYYNSLIGLLTLPENFKRLVVPNSSKDLEDIAAYLSDLRNEKDDDNAMATLLDRTEMTNLRHVFVMAKNWVGRAATNITAHSVFQKMQMYLTSDYYRLALPHNTTIANDRDRVSFSSVFNREKVHISDILSMFVNSFVDVVKDPYIMKIIYSDRLVSTFMMLTRAGVPLKTLSLFMNQPIIRDYVKELDNRGVSSFSMYNKAARAIIDKKYKTSKATLDKTVLKVENADLENNIKSFYSNVAQTDASNAQQQLIFQEFVKYTEVASELFQITLAINYDTTSFRSEDELFMKQYFTEKVERDSVFSSVKELLKSSFLGTVEKNLDRASAALQSILKFNSPEYRSILQKILTEYADNNYLPKDKKSKVAEKMIASFLDYIIQIKKPFPIEDLVVKANSVANRIDEARAKYPEVRILRDLVLVSSDNPGGAKTVKLRVNTKEAYDEDLYVGYMREMRDNPNTADLYKDLINLAIIQGTYYSSVSIKNIVPVEDYAAIVAPIMANLRIDSDIRAFAENKMFQRNLFKDDSVVGRITPEFVTDEETGLIGYDMDDVEINQYYSKAFPEIPSLGLFRDQRSLFLVNTKSPGTNYSVVTVPRIMKIGGERVDYVTGQTVSDAFYAERKAKGDRTLYDVYGYKRVEEADGTPLMIAEGYKTYYVYKQINLLGDGQLAAEYSVYPRKSVMNNSTVKVETEIPDLDIIRYFVQGSEIVEPTLSMEEQTSTTSTFTLKDGKTYNANDVNTKMLTDMGYSLEEAGKIINQTC